MSIPMMSLVLILANILLFVLVLKVKLQAFLALLIVSMGVGLAMGMPAEKILNFGDSHQNLEIISSTHPAQKMLSNKNHVDFTNCHTEIFEEVP